MAKKKITEVAGELPGTLKGFRGGTTGLRASVPDEIEAMMGAYERLKYILEPEAQEDISGMPEKQRKLLIDLSHLLRGVMKVDEQIGNMMTVTGKIVEEARSLEKGLMELPDGRILVEYVRDNMPRTAPRPTWQ